MNVDTPDFWQERYIDDNIPWDTKTTTPALIDSIDHSTRKKIAILGCGYSRDSIFLSSKKHNVYSVDFASKPIEYLSKIKNQYNIDTLNPINADIFNLPNMYPDFFDIVLEYTCFCAIMPSRRLEYVKLVSKILNKNGQFIALFFPINKREGQSDGPPFYVNLKETLSMFGDRFVIKKIDKNIKSIKPRRGFETLVIMTKK